MDEAEIHRTMQRLYHAAYALRSVAGQSAVARLLNVSPQVVKNWEARGISKAGAIAAQNVLGCSAAWLIDGAGEMIHTTHSERAVDLTDNPDQRRHPRKVCTDDVFIIGRIVHKQSERI